MDPYIDYEINSPIELMLAIEDIKTGGYEADVNVHPRHGRDADFLVIDVTGNYPGVSGVYGEYWFDATGSIMQVL